MDKWAVVQYRKNDRLHAYFSVFTGWMGNLKIVMPGGRKPTDNRRWVTSTNSDDCSTMCFAQVFKRQRNPQSRNLQIKSAVVIVRVKRKVFEKIQWLVSFNYGAPTWKLYCRIWFLNVAFSIFLQKTLMWTTIIFLRVGLIIKHVMWSNTFMEWYFNTAEKKICCIMVIKQTALEKKTFPRKKNMVNTCSGLKVCIAVTQYAPEQVIGLG